MSEHDYEIENRDKIISVLNGLQLSKAPLHLVISDQEESWNTTVLKVLPDAGCFYLSTLGVPHIDRRLIDGQTFGLDGRDRGILIKMDVLAAIQTDELGASDILSIAIPDKLEYLQQRGSVRIDIANHSVALVMMHENLNQPGALVDISYEGCGIEFVQGTLTKMPAVGSIVILKIDLPENQEDPLEVSGRICHIASAPGVANVGITFHALNLRAQNIIDQFVLKQQRSACRSRQRA